MGARFVLEDRMRDLVQPVRGVQHGVQLLRLNRINQLHCDERRTGAATLLRSMYRIARKGADNFVRLFAGDPRCYHSVPAPRMEKEMAVGVTKETLKKRARPVGIVLGLGPSRHRLFPIGHRAALMNFLTLFDSRSHEFNELSKL